MSRRRRCMVWTKCKQCFFCFCYPWHQGKGKIIALVWVILTVTKFCHSSRHLIWKYIWHIMRMYIYIYINMYFLIFYSDILLGIWHPSRIFPASWHLTFSLHLRKTSFWHSCWTSLSSRSPAVPAEIWSSEARSRGTIREKPITWSNRTQNSEVRFFNH